jgi:cobalt/nickel transport system permease protein
MATLIVAGMFRLRDDEIPRVAVMTAAVFIGSFIHVPLGPSSVHLIMNGMAGIVLGPRIGVAIPIGLLLQAVLAGHGAVSTWGVNSCVMILPALAARPMFLRMTRGESLRIAECGSAVACVMFPWSALVTIPLLVGGRRLRARLRISSAFEAGFVVCGGVVLATSVLHSLVLALGGLEDWKWPAILSLAVHLPVAAIEAFVGGAMMDIVVRVRPKLVGLGE